MSNQKKLNGESYVGMTHLLKKAVMVPNEEKQFRSKRANSQPFTRGIMKFDDFNYKAFNEHVLVLDPGN